MGGYNTTCEILAHGKRALIVPRVRPRTEQLIRAQRLSRLGLIDLMHPDALSATGLTDWMARAYGRQTSGDQAKVDLGGFGRLPFFLSALLAGEPTTYAKPINIRPRSECLTQ
jgi:predicted glycosyltransferase